MNAKYAIYDDTSNALVYTATNVVDLVTDGSSTDEFSSRAPQTTPPPYNVKPSGDSYVNKLLGSDTYVCSSTAPCVSIYRALLVAGMQRRVRVFEGNYVEADMLDIVNGIKLQSEGAGTDPEKVVIQTVFDTKSTLFYIRAGPAEFTAVKFLHEHTSFVGNFFLINGGISQTAVEIVVKFTNVVFTQQRRSDYVSGSFIRVESSAVCALTFENTQVRNISFSVSPFDVRGAAKTVIIATNAQFERITTAQNGGVFFSQNDETFTSSNFTNVVSQRSGGVIFSTGNRIAILKCTFSACSATGAGGVIFTNIGTISITECSFDNCQSTAEGGVAASGHALESINSSYTNCNAQQAAGGALFLDSSNTSPLTITNCTFGYTRAGSQGGAAYSRVGGAIGIVVQRSNFTGNNAQFGGALFTDNAAVNADSCQFSQIFAQEDGGAIASFKGVQLTSCFFESCNTAGNGAVFVRGNVNIIRSTFALNNARAGGAVYLDTPNQADTTLYSITASAFLKNTALFGGALYVSDLVQTVSRVFSSVIFDGNSATNENGGNDIFDLFIANRATAGLVTDLTTVSYTLTKTCSLSDCYRVTNVQCDPTAQLQGINKDCVNSQVTLTGGTGSVSGTVVSSAAAALVVIVVNAGSYTETSFTLSSKSVVAEGITSASGDITTSTASLVLPASNVVYATLADGGYLALRRVHIALPLGRTGRVFEVQEMGLLDIFDCRISPISGTVTGYKAILYASNTSLGAINFEQTLVTGITVDALSSVLEVHGRTRLAIVNSTFTQIAQDNTAAAVGGAVVYATAPLTVRLSVFDQIGGESSIVSTTALGGVIYTENEVTISDVAVSNIRGRQGGFLHHGNGGRQFGGGGFGTIERLTVENVTTQGAGGALYSQGNLRISYSRFTNISAPTTDASNQGGGAIYTTGQLTLEFTFFFSIYTNGNGGAIFHQGARGGFGASIQLDDVGFVGCTCDLRGGSLNVNGSIDINLCEFINSTAGVSGGSVEVSGQITMTRVSFTNSTVNGTGGAVEGGGAILSRGGSVTRSLSFYIVSFLNATTKGSFGGGIRILDIVSSINFTSCGFYSCSSSGQGGGAIAIMLSGDRSSGRRYIGYTNFYQGKGTNPVDVLDTASGTDVWRADLLATTPPNLVASCYVNADGSTGTDVIHFAQWMDDTAGGGGLVNKNTLLELGGACTSRPKLVRAQGNDNDGNDCENLPGCATIYYALSKATTNVVDLSVGGASTGGATFEEQQSSVLADKVVTIRGADELEYRIALVDQADAAYIFTVNSNVNLTITDIGIFAPDVLAPADDSGYVVGVLGINNSLTFGDLSVRHPRSAAASTGGFLYVSASANTITVLIRNIILGPLASAGRAGVYVIAGDGANVTVTNTSFFMVGGIVEGGASIVTGNGKAIYSSSPLRVNNSQFNNCSSGLDGGAVFASHKLNITNSDFTGCSSSPGNGGAVAAVNDRAGATAWVDIRNTRFVACSTTRGTGGAIYINIAVALTRNFYGVNFENNSCGGGPGGNIVDIRAVTTTYSLSNFIRCCSRGTGPSNFLLGDPSLSSVQATDLTSIFSYSCQTLRNYVTPTGTDNAACSVDAPCKNIGTAINLVNLSVLHEVEVAEGLYDQQVFTVQDNNVEVLGVSRDLVRFIGSVTLNANGRLTLDRISLRPSQTATPLIAISGADAILTLRYASVVVFGTTDPVTTDFQTVITVTAEPTSVVIQETLILNLITGYGGVGATSNVNVSVTDSVFANITGRNAGGIFGIIGTNSRVNIQRSNFTDITAVDSSGVKKNGAVLSSASSFVLQFSEFIRCSALRGGAIYFNVDPSLTNQTFNITRCTFSFCSAQESGGAIHLEFQVPSPTGNANTDRLIDAQRHFQDDLFGDNTSPLGSDVFDYYGNTTSYVRIPDPPYHAINLVATCSNSTSPQFVLGGGGYANGGNADAVFNAGCHGEYLYVDSSRDDESENCGVIDRPCKYLATAISTSKSDFSIGYIQLVGNSVPFTASEIYITSSLIVHGRAVGGQEARLNGDINYRIVFVVEVSLTLETLVVNLLSGRVGRDTTFIRVNGSGRLTVRSVQVLGDDRHAVDNPFIAVEEIQTLTITLENTSFLHFRLTNASLIFTGSNSPLLLNVSEFRNVSGAAVGLCLSTHSPLTVMGSNFSNIYTTASCAAIYAGYSSSLIIERSNFYSMLCAGNGSAVYINSYFRDTTIIISNSSFSACRSSLYGGAIYFNITTTSPRIISNTAFLNNSANTKLGNDIYSESSQAQTWTTQNGSCSTSDLPQITVAVDETGKLVDYSDRWDSQGTLAICGNNPYIPPENNTNNTNDSGGATQEEVDKHKKKAQSAVTAVVVIVVVLVIVIIAFVALLVAFYLYRRNKLAAVRNRAKNVNVETELRDAPSLRDNDEGGGITVKDDEEIEETIEEENDGD